MKRTDNINIEQFRSIPTPQEIRDRFPLSEAAAETVDRCREELRAILDGKDHRIFVVVGPCSIHDPRSALEYAGRLKKLAGELSDTFVVIMRMYFEKPRTTVGWKGYVNDPDLDDSFNIEKGLAASRELLLRIAEMGLPAATEALDPISPQYTADLISWYAIGARTTESQTHREMSSGLSAPVGFKNSTDGSVTVAVNAMQSSRQPHHFLGIDGRGQIAVFQTRGNLYGHLILRGGGGRPNYDSVSVLLTEKELEKAGMPRRIVIDCSHGNSMRDPDLQPVVFEDCAHQILGGNRSIVGFMLESHLHKGSQKIPEDITQLKYGVSITDACIDWETTEKTLRRGRERLMTALHARVP